MQCPYALPGCPYPFDCPYEEDLDEGGSCLDCDIINLEDDEQ